MQGLKKAKKKNKDNTKLLYSLHGKILVLAAVLLSLIPILDILHRVSLGNFAFWYDPARDLLAGLANLQKPTLIGPTSGIPGVFYGPYWIWLLSFGQLFSQDPRVIVFVVATLPYLLLFPMLLSKYKAVLKPTTLVLLWMFFLLNYNTYFTNLWNPYPAPLLILFTVYLLLVAQFKMNKKNYCLHLFAGISTGLLLNFHLSLGIGMALGLLFYFIATTIILFCTASLKSQTAFSIIANLSCFGFGFIVAFAPYLVFELRHQFLQTQAFLTAFLSYGGVVTLQGLSQVEILTNFFKQGAKLFSIPLFLFIILFIALVAKYAISFKNHPRKTEEVKLLSIVGSLFTGVMFIYFTAKNPIWDYHFIGIEILFLLLIGIFINQLRWIKALASGWIIILVIINGIQFGSSLNNNPHNNDGTFAAKAYVAQGIITDAGASQYVFYSLNPAIYMYDYSYLFKQLGGKDISYDPGFVSQSAKLVYLIIPPKSKNVADFTNFRAPKKKYKSVKQTLFPDGTLVIKKARID